MARDGAGVSTVSEIAERQFGGGAIERRRGYAIVYARAPGGEVE